MKRTIAALCLALLCNLTAAAAGKELPDKPMTIKFAKIGGRDAVKFMLDDVQLHYELDKTVTNNAKIDVDVENKSWKDAFQKILSDAKLTYRVDAAGKIHVSAK